MIDSKDLRQGNLFLDRGGKVLRIDWFEHNKLCMANHVAVEPDEHFAPDGKMFGHPYTEDVEFANPIQLTEHWLERFGFRKIKDEKSYCEDGDYTLVSNRFQVFTNDILTYNSIHGWWIDKKQFFIPCQYVHQLQNFHFALTGKELELTKQ